MDDFKKLTEQLMKIYSNAESVNDLGIENYFDENISLLFHKISVQNYRI